MSSPSSSEMPPIYDTIILGAGFAGLTAARRIAQLTPARILILEARDRIGGRVLTANNFDTPVDVGASWIHGWREGNPVKDLCEELGIKVKPNLPSPSLIIDPTGQPLSPLLASKISTNLTLAQQSCSTLSHSSSSPSPTTSLASILFSPTSPLYKNLSTSLEKSHAESIARTAQIGLGVELEKVSLKWSTVSEPFAGTDGAPEGGYERVVEGLRGLCEDVGVEVELGRKVVGLREVKGEEGEGVEVVVEQEGKQGTRRVRANTVISTIPLAVLKTLSIDGSASIKATSDGKGFFNPALSARKISAINRTHVGKLGKIVLGYEKPWWDNSFGSFTLLASSSSSDSQQSAPGALEQEEYLQKVFGKATMVTSNLALPTAPTTPHPSLLTYVPVPITSFVEKYVDKQKLAEAFHQYLIQRLPRSSEYVKEGNKEIPLPKQYSITTWSTDPLSLGATSTPILIDSHSDSAQNSPLDLHELGKSEWAGRLGFAGEHTEMNHRGSVGGAVVSGMREGERVGRLLMKWKEDSGV